MTIRCRLLPDQSAYRLEGDFPLVDMANRFLKIAETRGLSFYTVRSYGYDLVAIFRWLESTEKRFRSVKHKDLYEFINSLKEKSSRPATINRILTAAQLFYRYCYGKEIPRGKESFPPSPYYRNVRRQFMGGCFHARPHSRALRVKPERKLIEPLTPVQVNAFFEHLVRYRDLAIAQLMLLCGLRACEVTSLLIRNLDLVERRMRVTGKGKKERMLPIPSLVVTTLERYLRYERPKKTKSDAVFVVLQGKRTGSAMTYDGLRSLFRNRRKRGNLKNANPHRFRHTFGANMAKERVPLPALQRMLGHTDPRVTMNYVYLSMTDISDEFNRAMEKIGERYGN
jgi:site-specific recombinase XerD